MPNIAFVNRVQNTVTSGNSTSASTAPAAHAAGGLIAVFLNFIGSVTVTVTDLAGNTYTSTPTSPNSSYVTQIWYVRNCLGHAANVVKVTVNGGQSSGWLTISASHFTNIHATAPLQGISKATGSGTTPSAGLLPILGSAETLIFAGFDVSSGTYTAGGPGYTFTKLDPTGVAAGRYYADEWKIVTAPEEAICTCASGGWGATSIAFAGADTVTTTVPNVVGLSEAAATSALTGAGLVKGQVTGLGHPTIPEGNVLQQFIPPGTATIIGAPVALQISLGPNSIALVWQAIGTATAHNTAVTLNPDVDTTTATLLVAEIAWTYGNTNYAVTVNDSKGNVWLPLPGDWSGSPSQMWYCLNPIVGINHVVTVVASTANSWPGFVFYAFSGVEQIQLHKTIHQSGGRGVTLNDIFPSLDKALIVTGMGSTITGTTSINAGFETPLQIPYTSTQTHASGSYQVQVAATNISALTWAHGPGTSYVSGAPQGAVAVFLPKQPVVAPVANQIVFHAVAFVGEDTHKRTNGSTVSYTSNPINTTNANLLVAWLSTWINWGTIIDSYGNFWTEMTRRNNGNFEGRFFYCTGAVVGPNHTFTFPNVEDIGGIICAFSGVNIFQIDVGATGTTPLAAPSVTPIKNGSLVLAGLAASSEGIASLSPAGFRIFQLPDSGNQQKSAVGYYIQPIAAPIATTWSGTPALSSVTVATAIFTEGLATAEGRVTQLPVEIVVKPDLSNVTVTLSQLPIEIVVRPLGLPPVQLTQVVTEVLLAPVPPAAAVSQVVAEVMIQPISNLPARVAQVAVEVMLIQKSTGGVVGPFMGGLPGTIWID